MELSPVSKLNTWMKSTLLGVSMLDDLFSHHDYHDAGDVQ
jgi:hypothetical protein